MPNQTSGKAGDFYHVTISLDALNDPDGADDAFIARPVSESEAMQLAELFRKVGRNQSCPCGSGRKFKRCCLQKAH